MDDAATNAAMVERFGVVADWTIDIRGRVVGPPREWYRVRSSILDARGHVVAELVTGAWCDWVAGEWRPWPEPLQSMIIERFGGAT